ncbi:MAG: electron transfer flavoprotein subunit alpha/FixB family protein [Candidatus Saccharibacteria bacterium]
MAILVFSNKDDIAIELLSKGLELGKALGMEVVAITMSGDAQALADRGVKVYKGQSEALSSCDAAVCAEALEQLAKKAGAKILLIGSNRRGKEVGTRLAQKLGAGCVTDVSSIEVQDGKLVCSRNAFGGATIAVQSIASDIQVICANPRTFEPAPAVGGGSVEEVALSLKAPRTRVVEVQDKNTGSADIEGAEVLVCVGKGLSKQEDLKMVEELATAVGGMVACSKPIATDEKWMSEDLIIGLSGKKGKPQLAICLGISGQVQFTVGIRDAKTIVAVNNDQNAYIFQMADYGIVGDIYDVVPKLAAALKK